MDFSGEQSVDRAMSTSRRMSKGLTRRQTLSESVSAPRPLARLAPPPWLLFSAAQVAHLRVLERAAVLPSPPPRSLSRAARPRAHPSIQKIYWRHVTAPLPLPAASLGLRVSAHVGCTMLAVGRLCKHLPSSIRVLSSAPRSCIIGPHAPD